MIVLPEGLVVTFAESVVLTIFSIAAENSFLWSGEYTYFSDTSSIYEGIIFEANLRKYRDMLIVGQSYVLGTDFTDDNGQIRVEVKKIYNLEDIVKFETADTPITSRKNLKIKTNSIDAVKAIKELDIAVGEGTIMLIFNDKNVKIGEKFQINDILAEKLRNIPEISSVDLY